MEKELVSVEWLKKNQSKNNLIILDASPKQTASAKVSSLSELYIPNARRFNIKEDFTNKESQFPNTVPSAAQFEQNCQALGINQNAEIVVYDNLGMYASPRVWWLFKLMGHENVRVLNGGLPEWVKMGFETVNITSLKEEYSPGDFQSNIRKEFIVSFEDISENIQTNKFLVIDARSEGRFNGTKDEPRKNLQSGKIPNSVNIPYQTLLDEGKFKSAEEIKNIFTQKTNNNNKLVFSCGSGMTACILILASEIAFQKSKYLYDGSWTEYAIKNKLLK